MDLPVRRVARPSLWWTAGLSLVFIAALYSAWRWGRSPTLTADATARTETNFRADSLAFPDGRLVASAVTGWTASVWRRDALTSQPRDLHSIDLRPLTRRAMEAADARDPKGSKDVKDPKDTKGYDERDVRQQAYPRASKQNLPNQSLLGRPRYPDLTTPIVAVSPDGKDAAWLVGGNLLASPLESSATPSMQRGVVRSNECALMFGGDALVVACDGSPLQVRTRDGSRVRHEVAAKGNAWALRQDGATVFALSDRELFAVRDAGAPRRVTAEFPRSARAFTASASDLFAIATNDGTVLVATPERFASPTVLTAPGAADAVSFFDRDRVIVGGAFRGIYLLAIGSEPTPLIANPVETRLLAVYGSRVAYAAGDRIGLVSINRGVAFNQFGWTMLGLAGLCLLPSVLLVWRPPVAERERILPSETGSRRGTPSPDPVLTPPPVSSTPQQVLPLPDPPEGLIRACINGECILYAGAGLSAQAGYPTWQPFVERLLAFGIERSVIDPSFGESLKAALQQGQVDPVADSVVSAIGKPAVLDQVRATFDGGGRPLTAAHRSLAQIPFCAALTTNFDDLLERTFPSAAGRAFTPRDGERLLEVLGRREFFIGKLYGSLAQPESLLVAPAEYAETVSRNLPFSQFMEGLFVSRTLLFVGASLEGIEAYLSGLTFRGQMTRPHYALVAALDAGWRAKADLLRRRYGIEVLPYTPGANFPELPQFLERLARATAPRPEAVSSQPAPAKEGLRRVHMINIGPFRELDLDLQSDWNVILGDNGVGKSSILRAIAACICGKDAEPYAGRLVRSGEPSGSIVLETPRNTYRMELRRKDRGAEVNVVPARPLEVEGSLALGFPPLRAVSWERPKGPTSEGRRRPTVEDLLPIVKGDPDPRLDRLKQWIVNLDARINYERSQGSGDARFERLLSHFFQIVDKVTPGMLIKFGRVNPDTHEVTVLTHDGEIPIEMISQGSISLMGWIGVLLQRLYEIHGEDEDPTRRYALVLIDEIDAHMHPEWQQSVIHDMTDIFPAVQYIATTHSPLVVGGMRGRQVLRFVRNEAGETERVEVTDDMLVGRADQILTGRLFGMKTTLDQHTQNSMETYKVLLGRKERNPDEEIEFQRLNRELKFKIPVAEETPPERRAFALVEAIVNDQIAGSVPEARKPLLDKAQALLDEITAVGKPR